MSECRTGFCDPDVPFCSCAVALKNKVRSKCICKSYGSYSKVIRWNSNNKKISGKGSERGLGDWSAMGSFMAAVGTVSGLTEMEIL